MLSFLFCPIWGSLFGPITGTKYNVHVYEFNHKRCCATSFNQFMTQPHQDVFCNIPKYHTSSPLGILKMKGSLQSRIPVVSLSIPPRHEKPSKGESSSPSQSGWPYTIKHTCIYAKKNPPKASHRYQANLDGPTQ